jgi:hypothetical protein
MPTSETPWLGLHLRDVNSAPRSCEVAPPVRRLASVRARKTGGPPGLTSGQGADSVRIGHRAVGRPRRVDRCRCLVSQDRGDLTCLRWSEAVGAILGTTTEDAT